MNVDLSFLHLPTQLLTALILAIGLVRLAFWVKGARINGNSGPHPADVTHMATVATSLNSSAVALAQIAERLSNVPTRLEFREAVTEIRHDTRNVVGGMQAEIAIEIHEARDQVITAIEEARAS